ncbi:deoxyribose-phosphate aldolase [Legionella fairfieldensis]|uniref:deoxyribose-phosphate aldolase n=1 Tax=Legionella fairfieldensis TaxID=45064 RepID=UPI00049013F5|nr:deoxyribose-phosphate aldolase [Legionella fairfieldensis]
MKLEESYLMMLEDIKATSAPYSHAVLSRQIISLIDLTLLDETADSEALDSLIAKANCHQVAAVCVLPQHLPGLESLERQIKRATVINFPHGNQSTKKILTAIDTLQARSNMDEIDYVFPYKCYLAGDEEDALIQCQNVYDLCKNQKIGFKVILETGALPSLEVIYQLSRKILERGCDFLKTSTGKIPQGATPAAAFAMLKAIKDSKSNCGLKVSGGIKKPEQAFNYFNLVTQLIAQNPDKSCFRIGASSLLDALINNIN